MRQRCGYFHHVGFQNLLFIDNGGMGHPIARVVIEIAGDVVVDFGEMVVGAISGDQEVSRTGAMRCL